MGQAIETALSLKEKYGTNNPFLLCDCLDICYLFLELPPHIKGFYSLIDGSKILFINTSVQEKERMAVCAHELGHALLHEKSNAIFMSEKTYHICSKFEREADLFSAYLLLDELEPDRQDAVTLENIACATGLPLRLVGIRYAQSIQDVCTD